MTGPAHDDRYGTYGHAIMHPDALIREKARRYVDGLLPDLPPMIDDVREVDGDGASTRKEDHPGEGR